MRAIPAVVVRLVAVLLAAGAGLAGCADADPRSDADPAEAPTPAGPERIGVVIGGETFDLELALDSRSRYRGLSGRVSIPRNGGMLFAFPELRLLRFVMRDCYVPIDVAFIDERGRVVAIHEMPVEAPREPDESPRDYERRLRAWSSEVPARFAIEMAGGRLASLGVRAGQHVQFDMSALTRRAR